MAPARVRFGEAIASVSGAVLLVSLFLPWFGSASAWEAFSVADVLLAVAALAGIALALLGATQRKTDLPISGAALSALAGIVATTLVAYRVLDPVDGLDRELGLFVGLLAAIGVAAGAWSAMGDEGTRA